MLQFMYQQDGQALIKIRLNLDELKQMIIFTLFRRIVYFT